MKKQTMLTKLSISFLVMLLTIFMGAGSAWAIPQEQIGWDVVYDSDNNNIGKIYNEKVHWVSSATRSNGYPGIAYTISDSDSGSPNGLAYTECVSGDCATGDGGGWENWTTPTNIENIGFIMSGNTPYLDFDLNDNPTITYTQDNARLILAKRELSSWTKFQIGSNITNNDGKPDLVIDDNNNHFIAFGRQNSLRFALCDDGSVSGCDEANDWNINNSGNYYYQIGTTGNWVQGISLDKDPDGVLHLTYGDGNNLYYTSCDFVAEACDLGDDWTTPYKIASGQNNPITSHIDAATGTLAVAFTGASAYLKYAEYVGSGGNCDDDWGGDSDAWACTNVTNSNLTLKLGGASKYALSMDISGAGERGIAIGKDTNTNMHYVSCSSNCTTASSWGTNSIPVFVDDGQAPQIRSGYYISMEFGSGPKIAANSDVSNARYHIYYAEQEGDEPPEEQIIPELPQSGIWKIVIAVLAFGLVIGMVAWRNKNKD